jgi:AmpE protein
MTFIVTFIALIIERFFDWSHLRGWQWFFAWAHAIKQRFMQVSSYAALAIVVLPLVLLTVFINWLISGWLYGFITLIFQLVIFIYCLGPKNLWADGFACINALVQGDPQVAADKLKASFGATDGSSYRQSLHHHLLSNIFVESNRRVFAIVFWFFILGPAGAVLYRLLALLATDAPQAAIDPQLVQDARTTESILDWVPVRILTFIFALGGHFVQVISIWRKQAPQGLTSNEAMLTECGYAALGLEVNGTIVEDGTAERHAISLLDRSFIIVLVVIAIMAVLGLG